MKTTLLVLAMLLLAPILAVFQLVDEHLRTCPVCNWEKARFQRRCWRCARG